MPPPGFPLGALAPLLAALAQQTTPPQQPPLQKPTETPAPLQLAKPPAAVGAEGFPRSDAVPEQALARDTPDAEKSATATAPQQQADEQREEQQQHKTEKAFKRQKKKEKKNEERDTESDTVHCRQQWQQQRGRTTAHQRAAAVPAESTGRPWRREQQRAAAQDGRGNARPRIPNRPDGRPREGSCCGRRWSRRTATAHSERLAAPAAASSRTTRCWRGLAAATAADTNIQRRKA